MKQSNQGASLTAGLWERSPRAAGGLGAQPTKVQRGLAGSCAPAAGPVGSALCVPLHVGSPTKPFQEGSTNPTVKNKGTSSCGNTRTSNSRNVRTNIKNNIKIETPQRFCMYIYIYIRLQAIFQNGYWVK